MLELRETNDIDINFIAACLNDSDENFASQCGYGKRYFTFPVNYEQIKNFQKTRKDKSVFLSIYNKDIIGSLELIIDFEERKCTVARFLLAALYRNKGYGTQALKKVCEYAFNTLDLDMVKLSVFDFNLSAMKCYEKSGFVQTSKDIRDNGWVAINMEKRRAKL